MAQLFVVGAMLVIATYDIVVGVRLLALDAPHRVNGADTIWARDGAALFAGDGRVTVQSLYQRVGAFSLHTGVATFAIAIAAHDQPRVLACVLGLYTLTGLAFFAGDRRFFRGTRYFVVKQLLGALWAAAMLVELVVVSVGA